MKKGYTLIEFLVVVAIISILIVRIGSQIDKDTPEGFPRGTTITRIDGCQYIESGVYNNFTRTHKGNCDNPVHYTNPKIEK